LGISALYENLSQIQMWGHTPWARIPKAALAYDIGKLSTGCLVLKYLYLHLEM